MVRFDLFDPTNIASSGLNVCLFEKTRKALPEPAAGDIVLLRSIAVSPHARILETGNTHFILGGYVQQLHVPSRTLVQGLAMGYFSCQDSHVLPRAF